MNVSLTIHFCVVYLDCIMIFIHIAGACLSPGTGRDRDVVRFQPIRSYKGELCRWHLVLPGK